MIIDVNLFIGAWPFETPPNANLDGTKRVMGELGVAAALACSLSAVCHKNPDVPSRRFRDELNSSESAKTIIPLGVLSPLLASWRRDLADAVDEEVAGVKLFPGYHGYHPLDDRMNDLLEALSSRRVPTFFQLKMEDPRSQHPVFPVDSTDLANILDLAGRFPELTIIAVAATKGEISQCANRIVDVPNVFFDVSWIEGVGSVERCVDLIGVERLLFGTHHPLFTAKSALLKIVRSDLNENQRRMIFSGNARRLFPRFNSIK